MRYMFLSPKAITEYFSLGKLLGDVKKKKKKRKKVQLLHSVANKDTTKCHLNANKSYEVCL